MYQLPQTLSEEISYFGSLIEDFTNGKLEPVKFKAIRVPMGIYEQRTDHTYMVRIRCGAGYISPYQLKQVALIAKEHGSNILHLTTRQEIQIQNVDLQYTLLILQNLKEIGLTSKGGGGNTVRNIMTSIDSGISKNEVFDVTPYAINLTSKLIAEQDSFTLPRKFKIAFSNSEDDTAFAAFNDLGFIAKIQDGKRGFSVFLGGSLGSKPMVGFELFEFAPESELFNIADAAKKLFSRYGNRKNKHKARLRFVFYQLGKNEVFRLFFEIYNEIKKAQNTPFVLREQTFRINEPKISAIALDDPAFRQWKDRYVLPQQQNGLVSITIPFEHGNLTADAAGILADFLLNFSEDSIRFSMRQNVHLRNIPESHIGNVYQFIQSITDDLNQPFLINNLVSCTGADTCRLGICLSKGAIGALKSQLKKTHLNLDLVKDLKINISGCPNSCGQQIASDLGFYGKVGRNNRMYPAYHVVAGASIGKNAKLAELKGEISAYDLPAFTEEILSAYTKSREKYTSFYEFVNQDKENVWTTLLNKYKTIPDFKEDKNYYFDWGSDQIFSLTSRGVGECSAGLFDMIDVDLKHIKLLLANIHTNISDPSVNRNLWKVIYYSARMLLITRGAEPKTEVDVFLLFIEKFIQSKLISPVFTEVILLAKDHKEYPFIQKKSTVFELADAVIQLYEGMDDSLQFRLEEEKSSTTNTPKDRTVRKKDFRGVACPMNFVKTKIELSNLHSGDHLEIWLDDGEPIENVPGSIQAEGHRVLKQGKIDNYWQVLIEKA